MSSSENVIQKLSGASLILSCIGFILFLAFYSAFLPVNRDNSNYAALIQNRNWIWINVIQLFAILFGIFGSIGLVYGLINKFQGIGIIGLFFVISGYVLMAGLSFTETFSWAALAKQINTQQMTEIAGSTLKTYPYSVVSLLGFHLFSLGYLIIGTGMLFKDIFPKWMSLCIVIGSILLSVSYLFPIIRYTLSPIAIIILFAGGLIPVGIRLIKG
jgi:hypothetical protein